MKERYCYFCGKRLELSDLIDNNFHLNQDYLKSLWTNQSIEFLCCDCFKEENLWNKGLNRPLIKNDLKTKEVINLSCDNNG